MGGGQGGRRVSCMTSGSCHGHIPVALAAAADDSPSPHHILTP